MSKGKLWVQAIAVALIVCAPAVAQAQIDPPPTYNAVLTPWLNLSASMQVVDSAVGKTISSNGRLVDMPTTVVGGLRMYIRF